MSNDCDSKFLNVLAWVSLLKLMWLHSTRGGGKTPPFISQSGGGPWLLLTNGEQCNQRPLLQSEGWHGVKTVSCDACTW